MPLSLLSGLGLVEPTKTLKYTRGLVHYKVNCILLISMFVSFFQNDCMPVASMEQRNNKEMRVIVGKK